MTVIDFPLNNALSQKGPFTEPYRQPARARQILGHFLQAQTYQTLSPVVLNGSVSQNSHSKISGFSEPILIDDETMNTFREELGRIFISNDKLPEIATKLFEITPSSLPLERLVECIFQECYPRSIPLLLDAIHLRHPQFTLSPLFSLCKTILQDRDHLLTNDSLQQLFKDRGIEMTEARLQACFDLAYHMKHPYIYRVSKSLPSPTDYTLNFLWVNLNPQDRDLNTAQNIFGNGLDPYENDDRIRDPKVLRHLEKTEHLLSKEDLQEWQKVKKSFTYRISKWADAHPSGQINLWYDSALVTQKAQQKTFEMMQAIAQSRSVNISLRDIRHLSITPQIDQSLHPGTPVFFRVDMLKILIADYLMRSPREDAKYCVVSDVDIEPMKAEQMFDQRTADFLLSNGYVFNGKGVGGFENSFFIFNKEKKDLQKIHSATMIQKMSFQLEQLRQYPPGTRLRDDVILGSQAAFNNYHRFFLPRMENNDYAGLRDLTVPRKVVKCPPSQFDFGGYFSKSDHESETFRFIGSNTVPFTRNGRNNKFSNEAPIQALAQWKVQPLISPIAPKL